MKHWESLNIAPRPPAASEEGPKPEMRMNVAGAGEGSGTSGGHGKSELDVGDAEGYEGMKGTDDGIDEVFMLRDGIDGHEEAEREVGSTDDTATCDTRLRRAG